MKPTATKSKSGEMKKTGAHTVEWDIKHSKTKRVANKVKKVANFAKSGDKVMRLVRLKLAKKYPKAIKFLEESGAYKTHLVSAGSLPFFLHIKKLDKLVKYLEENNITADMVKGKPKVINKILIDAQLLDKDFWNSTNIAEIRQMIKNNK